MKKRKQRQRQREQQKQKLLLFVTVSFIAVTVIWIVLVFHSYWQDNQNKKNGNNNGRHPVPNEDDDALFISINNKNNNPKTDFSLIAVDPEKMVPDELLKAGIYKPTDFVNQLGVRVPYWREINSRSYGPCYSTNPNTNPIVWNSNNQTNYNNDNDDNNDDGDESTKTIKFIYRQELARRNQKNNKKNSAEYWEQFDPTLGVGGGCRPGFIILGAGKCGTSSLYHYLTAHPRVAPAYEKQIHYFKVSFFFVFCFSEHRRLR